MKGKYQKISSKVKFLKTIEGISKILDDGDFEKKIQKAKEEERKEEHKRKGDQLGMEVARTRYQPNSYYLESDVNAKAILDVNYYVNLSNEQLGNLLEKTVMEVKYKLHPETRNLFESMGNPLKINLNIPADGEVMYVIDTQYQLILAARSGEQRNLPHPTLLGGEPEILSAGIVEFKEDRIVRVEINASGHFIPNSPSSVEVSLGLFQQLPPNAFHTDCKISLFQHIKIDKERWEEGDTEEEIRAKEERNEEKRRNALPLLVHNSFHWGEGESPFSIDEAVVPDEDIDDLAKLKLKLFKTMGKVNSKTKINSILHEYIMNPKSKYSELKTFFTKDMEGISKILIDKIAVIENVGVKKKTMNQSRGFQKLCADLLKIIK